MFSLYNPVLYSWFWAWFGWPDGSVLTNLVASLIWGVVAWRKLHAIHKSHLELHKKIDAKGASSHE